jgi:hypothetical protein
VKTQGEPGIQEAYHEKYQRHLPMTRIMEQSGMQSSPSLLDTLSLPQEVQRKV